MSSSSPSSNPNPELKTTDILVQKAKGNNRAKDVYYIPGFFRIKVKNFTEMNFDDLDAQMNATLVLSIYYGDLHHEVVKKLKAGIVLNFERDAAILLTTNNGPSTQIKDDQIKKEVQFTIRKIFHLRISGDVFWTPFQFINLILSITVQSVKNEFGTFKFNLLDQETSEKHNQSNNQLNNQLNNHSKISYTEEGTFGYYDLAENLMRAEYTNDRVCRIERMTLFPDERLTKFKEKFNQDNRKRDSPTDKSEKKLEVKSFQYAHFNIPLYKYPTVALATIFLPLWLLGIINLGIFFQGTQLADRLSSIASLMIAFVALIPTIRDQIPPNPRIVFIEILVYFQILTSFLAFIHSMAIRQIQNFNLNWRGDFLFLLSVTMTVLNLAIVLFMLGLHRFYWLPTYNRTLQQQKEVKFDRKRWSSMTCDYYFNEVNKHPNNNIVKFVK